MNKIVLEHYPASKLPDDMRGSIELDASVTVTVEEEDSDPKLTREDVLRVIRESQRNSPGTTLEEAVARIRSLRDEWDD